MGYIYKITNKENNQVYIGQTNATILERWKGHCRTAFLPSHGDYNFPFHRAIRKYGKENFIIEEVECIEENNQELLDEREIYWISYYDSYNNGYNASRGGIGHKKYDYDAIVNFYLSNNFSILKTCKEFNIYDQVVYTALKAKGIDYKKLIPKPEEKNTFKNKRIYCVELDMYFDSMSQIDKFFNKQVHGNIRRCLNGITKKAYGFHWKEEDNE